MHIFKEVELCQFPITITHNYHFFLTILSSLLNTQHIGTIDLSSTVIYFITDNNVPYCCTPIKLYTPRKLSVRSSLLLFCCKRKREQSASQIPLPLPVCRFRFRSRFVNSASASHISIPILLRKISD